MCLDKLQKNIRNTKTEGSQPKMLRVAVLG